MKSLNSKEILRRYYIFLGYFTALLTITVLCGFLYFKTYNSYAGMLHKKKAETEFFFHKRAELSTKIDSLNNFINMLSTKQVKNEAALERAILKLKFETLKDIESMEEEGIYDYFLYKKVLLSVEGVLDAKKTLQQSKDEEEATKRKLMECNQANLKLRNRNQ